MGRRTLILLSLLLLGLAACASSRTPEVAAQVQPPAPTPTLAPTFTPTAPATTTASPTATIAANASLTGRVVDQATNQPVAEALVSVGYFNAVTGSDGRYTLAGLHPDRYVLVVNHPAYDPALSRLVTLTAGEEAAVDIPLYAPNASPYPEDPMLTNPLDPNGAPTEEDAERLAREQGLTGEVTSIRETKLSGTYLVNYKIDDDIRAAVAEIDHDAWELVDDASREWWIIKVCGNLASPAPPQAPFPTPAPKPLPLLAEVRDDRLPIRACPSAECGQVGTVSEGDRVEVRGCLADGSWCEIGWSGGLGWCQGQALRHLALAQAVPVVEARAGVDKGRLAFISDRDGNDEIYMIIAGGDEITRLTHTPEIDELAPAWSPDGQHIAFQSFHSGNLEVYTMRADGTDLRSVSNHPDHDWGAAWSPTGRHVAFTSARDGSRGSIYLRNVDDGSLARLGNGSHPTWSPDGTRLAFLSSDGIAVMNVDGSGLKNLGENGSFLAWSPNGQQIAFASRGEGNADIFLVDADGGNVTRLTTHPGEENHPTWSPDNQQIAYTAFRDSKSYIYVMNADGSNQTELTEGKMPAWSR